jgi:hypothetical protein
MLTRTSTATEEQKREKVKVECTTRIIRELAPD